MKQLKDIWFEAFNERCQKHQIISFLLEDIPSCTYRIEDGNELRLTTNPHMYNFSKILRYKNYKHVAKIVECFNMILPNQYGEFQKTFCVISEPLKRDFASKAIMQSGINLLTNSWSDYLRSRHRLDTNPYNSIDNAYSDGDWIGRSFVVKIIREASSTQTVKDIALALNNAFLSIKKLDPLSHLFLYTDNIGLAEDGTIKICNIGHNFMGLNRDYEIDVTSNTVTITYDPFYEDDNDYYIRDNRMLIPLRTYLGGNETPILGQIDTGASSSGFSESFYKSASLENFGKIKISGSTGSADAIKTRCIVKFPNGHIDSLHGSTCKKVDGVSVLIGMDLLSRCKFESEPFNWGFKYRLSFL